MRPETIRPIALCVCRQQDCILVAEGRDSRKDQLFYRPLGGTIEFGEHGADAVRREFREEIGAELSRIQYLGMLENIFIYEGQRGHEIALIYDGQLVDTKFYLQEQIEGDEEGTPFRAVWKRLSEFDPGTPPLYPDGLLTLLGN